MDREAIIADIQRNIRMLVGADGAVILPLDLSKDIARIAYETVENASKDSDNVDI